MPSFNEIPDPGWEPEVLEAKAKSIKRNAIIGVVVGAVGMLFFHIVFGFVLGGYAIYCGRDALADINIYGTGRAYQKVAQAALFVGSLAIILPLAKILVAILR